MSCIRKTLLIMLIVLPFTIISIFTPSQASSLSKVDSAKIAFIYNFTLFVTWSAAPSSSFSICILGDNPFGSAIKTLESKSAKSIPIRIITDIAMQDMNKCQLLFVSKSSNSQLSAILSNTGKYPLLTVSDIDGFAKRGGMIELNEASDKINLYVNKSSADKANLTISAKLLSLAKEVY